MAKKSLDRVRKEIVSGAAQEKLKRIRDHLTPFQDEHSRVRQSWFHDLIEWYAKVLFPKLQSTNEIVDLVQREFRIVDESGGFERKSFWRLTNEALILFEQLQEQHVLLDQQRRMFEIVRSSSHDLSDNIEVINSNLMSLLERLRKRRPPA